MDIAALILSTLSLIMSVALLTVFLAKNVFSSHSIQMVPVDPIIPGASPKPIGEEFEEFDMPSQMDVAVEEKK